MNTTTIAKAQRDYFDQKIEQQTEAITEIKTEVKLIKKDMSWVVKSIIEAEERAAKSITEAEERTAKSITKAEERTSERFKELKTDLDTKFTDLANRIENKRILRGTWYAAIVGVILSLSLATEFAKQLFLYFANFF